MGAPEVQSPAADPRAGGRDAWWALAAGVILFILGAKLGLIHHFGTDQPYADQWVGEGLFAAREPLYFTKPLRNYFYLQGEHTPTLMRLWARGLVAANGGQWDCLAGLVANLSIFGALAFVLWRMLAPLAGRWLAVLAVFLALLLGQPGAYENYLWGFQSCFLFLMLTAVVHVGGTLQAVRPGWRWAGAQFVGLLGLFSVAAGVASAAALVVLAAIELAGGRRGAWAWATFAVNAGLVALGLWLLPKMGESAVSRFDGLVAAVVRMGYLLAWPLPTTWWGLLLQAPGLVLAVRWLRAGRRDPGDRLLIGLGLWVWLAAFSIGYGRAITPATIGVRYYDVFLLGLLFNAVALLRLLPAGRGAASSWTVAVALWLALLGRGLWDYNKPSDLWPSLQYQRDLALEQEQVIERFFVSGDSAELEAYATRTNRFPHVPLTLDLLRDEKMRPFLPPSLAPGGATGLLSRAAPVVASAWPALLGAGVILLGWGAWRARRTNPSPA